MAAVSRPVNAEVIEVSDSDERGGTSGHVEPDWVRRSTRRRKASVRFSPDDEPTTSHRTPSRPAGRTSDKRLRMSDSSELTSDSNSSSGYEMELVHPQALITYIEKLKRKIRPGQFGINMPVGPNEFVLVDAVDYLRNLGYSNFEEVVGEVEDGENEVEEDENDAEEEKPKTELKFFESIKEEDVLFESQAAVKLEGGNGDSNESEEKLQEVNFWDQLGVHSKSSESRNQDLSDVISGSRSPEGSIDVEKVDLTAFNLRQDYYLRKRGTFEGTFKKERKAKKQRVSDDGDEDERHSTRQQHNVMERLRRMELANQFSTLSRVIGLGDGNPLCDCDITSGRKT
ncbi:hypothetical protein GE061_007891 [Apolygus lucorum]|uniref:Uncharacterized protein n=1 Tax=Apolygus lucorum TaxID=248454 RepID=A0A6A4J2D6_APOLU|nr:hypothetical protein GE061_007891 [Apolygus lucorum]